MIFYLKIKAAILRQARINFVEIEQADLLTFYGRYDLIAPLLSGG
jgi:hypothetical protein